VPGAIEQASDADEVPNGLSGERARHPSETATVAAGGQANADFVCPDAGLLQSAPVARPDHVVRC
jgi:hypothetical protein